MTSAKKQSSIKAVAEPTPHALDFAFTHNGETFWLPPLKAVKSGIIRRTRSLDPVDAMFTVMEAVASPEALEALDDMDVDEMTETTSKWQAHSGVSLGE